MIGHGHAAQHCSFLCRNTEVMRLTCSPVRQTVEYSNDENARRKTLILRSLPRGGRVHRVTSAHLLLFYISSSAVCFVHLLVSCFKETRHVTVNGPQQRETQSNTADVSSRDILQEFSQSTQMKLNESLQRDTDFSAGLLQLKTADFTAAYLKMMMMLKRKR